MVPISLNLLPKSVISFKLSIVIDYSGENYKKLQSSAKLPLEVTPVTPAEEAQGIDG